MEEKTKVKVEKKPASSSFVALVGFETSDGRIVEAGESVSGLLDIDIEALLEMNAIKKEK